MERLYEIYRIYRVPFPNESNSPVYPHEPLKSDFGLSSSFSGFGFDSIGQLFDDCDEIQHTYFTAMQRRAETKIQPLSVIMAEAAGRCTPTSLVSPIEDSNGEFCIRCF